MIFAEDLPKIFPEDYMITDLTANYTVQFLSLSANVEILQDFHNLFAYTTVL